MSPTNYEHSSVDKHPPDIPPLSREDRHANTEHSKRRYVDLDNAANEMNGMNNNVAARGDSARSKSESDDGTGFDLAKYETLEFRPQVRWPDMIVQVSLHLVSLYGLYRILTLQVKLLTVLFAMATTYTSAFGITAGAHRLWSHRAYRANTPLRLLLAFLFSITGQRDLYTWALDHRVHHKYSETAADPHDARRGFWFAHVGWLVLTPHPAVQDRRKELTRLSQDLLEDPVVYWQKILNVPLFALLNIGLPTWIPMRAWDESLLNGFVISFVTRFTVTLNIAFCVNSVAHFWGNKPYDSTIKPVENKVVSMMAMGEGWHNYHHTFPWDYKTSELGRVNPSTNFIDFFARLNWATDRKSASSELVELRSKRSGDGSRQTETHSHLHLQPEESGVWGFGDPDMPPDERLLIRNSEI